jgi:hypothetical protein
MASLIAPHRAKTRLRRNISNAPPSINTAVPGSGIAIIEKPARLVV